MEDLEIVEMFLARDEMAIAQTKNKYSSLLRHIAMGILSDDRDAEEVLSDTYMAIWDTIPPKKPENLGAYSCRIAKNLSLKKYEYNQAAKRHCEYEAVLDELADLIPSGQNVEKKIESNELKHAINRFIKTLPRKKQTMFLRRYWFSDSVKEIAADMGLTEKNASMRLRRIREKMKDSLSEGGYL